MNLTGRPIYTKATKEDIKADKDYQAWCRKQPSALSGLRPCIYAHHRDADNAGVAYKPLFSGLPLTYEEHLRQHQIGQYAFMPIDWWLEKIQYHLNKWKKKK